MSKLTVTSAAHEGEKWPVPVDQFHSGDVPVVRVVGCEGREITLQIVDVGSGRMALERSVFFPESTMAVGPERIRMGTVGPGRDQPVEPVRYQSVTVSRHELFWRLEHLRPGSYEVRLLIGGIPAEKFSFNISG